MQLAFAMVWIDRGVVAEFATPPVANAKQPPSIWWVDRFRPQRRINLHKGPHGLSALQQTASDYHCHVDALIEAFVHL